MKGSSINGGRNFKGYKLEAFFKSRKKQIRERKKETDKARRGYEA